MRNLFRLFVPVASLFAVVFLLANCSDSSGDCSTYCQKMQETNCFGRVVCYAETTTSGGQCASLRITENDSFFGDTPTQTQADGDEEAAENETFETSEAAARLVALDEWMAVEPGALCFYILKDGESYREPLASEMPEEIQANNAINRHEIGNPPDFDTCMARCKVNTQGASMPKVMVTDLENARTCIDFLQAELNQQCRSLAQER